MTIYPAEILSDFISIRSNTNIKMVQMQDKKKKREREKLRKIKEKKRYFGHYTSEMCV